MRSQIPRKNALKAEQLSCNVIVLCGSNFVTLGVPYVCQWLEKAQQDTLTIYSVSMSHTNLTDLALGSQQARHFDNLFSIYVSHQSH